MPTEQVVPKMTFQEKIAERVKDGIGDLLTDEDIAKLIAGSLHDMFFQKRRVPERYGSGYTDGDPLVFDILRPALKAQIDIAIAAWLKDNNDKVYAMIQTIIDQGIIDSFTRALESRMGQAFWDMGERMKQGLMLSRPA